MRSHPVYFGALVVLGGIGAGNAIGSSVFAGIVSVLLCESISLCFWR